MAGEKLIIVTGDVANVAPGYIASNQSPAFCLINELPIVLEGSIAAAIPPTIPPAGMTTTTTTTFVNGVPIVLEGDLRQPPYELPAVSLKQSFCFSS